MLISIQDNRINKPENLFGVSPLDSYPVAMINSQAFLFGKDLVSFMDSKEKLCECGCGEKVRLKHHRFLQYHHKRNKNYHKRFEKQPLCKCGCKEPVKWRGSKPFEYLKGHYSRTERYWKQFEIPTLLCKCGCGQNVKWNRNQNKWNGFIHGHTNKNKSLLKKHRNNISEAHIGLKRSEEHCKNISLGQKGRVSPRKGVTMLEETKELLRQAHLGKKHTEEHCKNKSLSNKGKKRTKEMRRKQSIACKEKFKDLEERIKLSCIRQGIIREKWTHFLTRESYCLIWTKDFKDMIKERDNYECQNKVDCWKTSKIVCSHHINYIKKDCNPWNIITICNSCHGRANYNRDKWQKFYENIIIKRGFGAKK